jgi:multisubunit Na+/H+ antiporter MnhE subunit
MGFTKMAIFRRKLAKIAVNTDHNIDPWIFPINVALGKDIKESWLTNLAALGTCT